MIVPRTTPRTEQIIRATRAAEHKLVTMLTPEEAGDPARLAAAIKALPGQPKPSEATYRIDLNGLERLGGAINEIKRRRGVRNRLGIVA